MVARAYIVLFQMFSFLLFNCASLTTVGKDFRLSNFNALVIDYTSKKDVENILGTPFQISGGFDEDGGYEIWTYYYSWPSGSEIKDKLLVLEFKGNLLNSYLKRFSDSEVGKENLVYFEKTVLEPSKNIPVGSFDKSGIKDLFGLPPIMGHCNSNIKAIKELCSKIGDEIWAYYLFANNKTTIVIVIFDSYDRVLEVAQKIEYN